MTGLRFELHRLGWLGVALCLMAGLMVAGLVASHLEARRLATVAPDDPTAAYAAREREIATLLAHFPAADSRERQVADLLDAATASRLEVVGGRYRQTPLEGRVLSRIEMTLPVAGDRLAVLRWVDALAAQLPALSLSRISLNRAAVSEPFSGDVRLDLFLRDVP